MPHLRTSMVSPPYPILPATARYVPWNPPPSLPDFRQSFIDPWDTYPLDNLSTTTHTSCPSSLDNTVHGSNGLDYTHATTQPCQNKPPFVFKESQRNNAADAHVYLPPVTKPLSYPYKDYNLNGSSSDISIQEPVKVPCESVTKVVFNTNSSHADGCENTLLHAAINHSNSTVVDGNVVHFQDLEVKHVPTQNNQHEIEIRHFQFEPNENHQEMNVAMHDKHSDYDSHSTTESPIRTSIHVYHSDPHLEASSYQQKTDKMNDGGDQSILVSSEKSDYCGMAGALAQLKIGEPRSDTQVALEEHWRRQSWEQGQIDYLGKDAFDKIWAKISNTLLHGPSPPEDDSSPPAPGHQPEQAVPPTEAPSESTSEAEPLEQPVSQMVPPSNPAPVAMLPLADNALNALPSAVLPVLPPAVSLSKPTVQIPAVAPSSPALPSPPLSPPAAPTAVASPKVVTPPTSPTSLLPKSPPVAATQQILKLEPSPPPAVPSSPPLSPPPIPRTPTVTEATPPTSPPLGPWGQSPARAPPLAVGTVTPPATPPATPPVGAGGGGITSSLPSAAQSTNQSDAEPAPIPPKRRGGPSKGGKAALQKGKM